MRARLATRVDAALLGFGDESEGAGGADVDDVEPGCGLSGDGEGQRDGLQLRTRGPRPGEVEGGGPCGRSEAQRVFRMDQQDGIELCDALHAFAQYGLVTGGEPAHAPPAPAPPSAPHTPPDPRPPPVQLVRPPPPPPSQVHLPRPPPLLALPRQA